MIGGGNIGKSSTISAYEEASSPAFALESSPASMVHAMNNTGSRGDTQWSSPVEPEDTEAAAINVNDIKEDYPSQPFTFAACLISRTRTTCFLNG